MVLDYIGDEQCLDPSGWLGESPDGTKAQYASGLVRLARHDIEAKGDV